MHRANKGILNNSLLKILSNAEHTFYSTLKIDGLEQTKTQYDPAYFRTLKRRLKLKYEAAKQFVYEMEHNIEL